MTRRAVSLQLGLMTDPRKEQEMLTKLDDLAKAATAEKDEASQLEDVEQMFRGALHLAISTIFESTDPNVSDRHSVGLSWLSSGNHTVLFRKIVQSKEFMDFFARHLDNPQITQMVSESRLIMLFPEHERSTFAKRVLDRYVPEDDGWVATLLNASVSPELLSESVTYWLHNPNLFLLGRAFPARFLHVGPGAAKHLCTGDWSLSDENALWKIMSEEHLTEALFLCARRVPTVFFAPPTQEGDTTVAHKIQLQLGKKVCREVLKDAAKHLSAEDVPRLSVSAFDYLGLSYRRALAHQLNGVSLPYLVKLSLDQQGGYAIYKEHVAKVMSTIVNPAADFAAASKLLFEAKQGMPLSSGMESMILRINAQLREEMSQMGYAFGTVELFGEEAEGWPLGIRWNDSIRVDRHASERDITEHDAVIFPWPQDDDTEVTLTRIWNI